MAGFARACVGVASIVLAGFLSSAHGAVNPTLCTVDVVHSLNDVVGVTNTVADTAVDCALPGLNEMSCAADISGLLGGLLDIAGLIGDMTLVCGDLDNTCAVQVMGGIEILTGLAATLIAASSDCMTDAFVCTFDVIAAVDVINGFAWNIIGAIRFCDNDEVHNAKDRFDFSDPGSVSTVLDRYAYLEFQGHRNWANFQRRLQDAMIEGRAQDNIDNAQEASIDASAAHNATATEENHFAEAKALHGKVNAELRRIRAQLIARGVKDIPLPSPLLVQPQAESVFV